MQEGPATCVCGNSEVGMWGMLMVGSYAPHCPSMEETLQILLPDNMQTIDVKM